jgi:hypothetical protein
MCDSFLNKKNHNGCPDCPYHHPERKPPTVPKFTRKKKANFDACLTPRRWARIDNPGSNIFAGVFFLLLKERKCITATFFLIFLFFN